MESRNGRIILLKYSEVDANREVIYPADVAGDEGEPSRGVASSNELLPVGGGTVDFLLSPGGAPAP